MDDVANRPWVTDSLRGALQALASPGRAALSKQPSEVARADELALDFDNFHRAFVGNFGEELSESQRSALMAVDRQLDAMSGQGSHLWTDEAVCSHPSWEAVRTSAAAALGALGWQSSN
jgi:acetoin utilization deacetylase AcuC-like enzyme